MRKHFLILMLLTLLPLTGWAEVAYRVVVNNGNNLTYKGTAWTVANLQGMVKIEKYDTSAPTTATATYTDGITVSLLKKRGTTEELTSFENVGTYDFKVEHAVFNGEPQDADIDVVPVTVEVTAQLPEGQKICFGDTWATVSSNLSGKYTFGSAPFTDTTTPAKAAFVKGFTDQFDEVIGFPESASTYVRWTSGPSSTFTITPSVTALNEAFKNFSFTSAASAAISVSARDLATGVNVTFSGKEYDGTAATAPVLKDKDHKSGSPAAPVSLIADTDYSVYYFGSAAAAAADTENDGTGKLTSTPKDAGTYAIKMVGKGNYGGAITQTYTITKATLDIETVDKNHVYGGTVATLAAAYGGWKNGEGNADGTTITAAYETGIKGIGYFLQKQGVIVPLLATTDAGEYDIVALPVNATDDPVTVDDDKIFKNYEVIFFNSGKYTVTPKPLAIQLKDQTKKYGIPHVLDNDAEIQINASNMTQFFDDFWTGGKVGSDAIATYPKVKRDGDKVVVVEGTAFTFHRPLGTVPETYMSVTAYYEPTVTSGNYIEQAGQMNVKAKTTSVVYGTKENLAAIELNITGAAQADMDAARPYLIKALKVKSTGNTAVDGSGDATTYPNVGYYELYLDEAIIEKNKSHYENYTIKAAKSTYQITKRQLTSIAVKPQSLNQGDGAAALVLDKNFVTITADGYTLTDEDNEKLFNADDGEFVLAFNESTTEGNVAQIPGTTPVTLNSQLEGTTTKTLKAAATAGTYVKAIKLKFRGAATALTNFELPKYVATPGADPVVIPNLDAEYADAYTMGALTVSASGATLALDGLTGNESTDADKKVNETNIKAVDGKKVATVTIANRSLKKEQWGVLVLPFATTVREVSAALGYAVVDVIDPTKGDENNVFFKLHMGMIPANTPFMVKTDANVDLSSIPATKDLLKNKTIVKDIDADGKTTAVDGAAGTKFYGLYKTVTLNSEKQWFMSAGEWSKKADGKTTKVNALRAYLQLPATADPNNARIFIEEPDGTTTVIKAVNVDGLEVATDGWFTLNGVKLQGVPAEKGVYIHNGKKVVLK